jgi:hypothetical protein
MSLSGFFAYPAKPAFIGQTIRSGLNALNIDRAAPHVTGWEENDIAGRFLAEPILANIDAADFLVADITRLNFNVVFEIGYAIGREKRIVLVRNSAFTPDDDLVREVGLFDTLGYKEYSQTAELVSLLRNVEDVSPISLSRIVNVGSPVYVVVPRVKTDAVHSIPRSRVALLPRRPSKTFLILTA